MQAAAISSQVTVMVSSLRQGTTQTPENHCPLWGKDKSHALVSLGPLLSWKPYVLHQPAAVCTNSIVGPPAAPSLKALAGLTAQGAGAGPQAVAPKANRKVNATLGWLPRLSGKT